MFRLSAAGLIIFSVLLNNYILDNYFSDRSGDDGPMALSKNKNLASQMATAVFSTRENGDLTSRDFEKAIGQLSGRLPRNNYKPMPPVKKSGVSFPSLSSPSLAALDIRSGQIFFSKLGQESWPIASLTKLMTAMVFLDHNPGWEEVYEIKGSDKREGGLINVFTGEKILVRDLFNLSLVGSDNVATIGLVNSTGLSEENFVAAMNSKAAELGLAATKFIDPAGLDDGNVSTAEEAARLLHFALLNKEIKEATLSAEYEFSPIGGESRTVKNTDQLLRVFPKNGIMILGGKTGHVNASGYCFAGKFTNHEGREIVSVVLGSADNNSRFSETHDLVEWIYANYEWGGGASPFLSRGI